MSPLTGLISDTSGEIWTIIYTGNYPEWTSPPGVPGLFHANLNVQQVLGGGGEWKCSGRGSRRAVGPDIETGRWTSRRGSLVV